MRDLPLHEGRVGDLDYVTPVEITLTFEAMEFDLVCGEVEANLEPKPRPYFLADWMDRSLVLPALNEAYGHGDVTFSRCHVVNARHLAAEQGFTPAYRWYTRPVQLIARWPLGRLGRLLNDG